MRMNRRFLLGGGLAAGAVAVIATRQLGATADTELSGASLDDPDNPVLGNTQGDVTLIEFFDYQCPFCKKNHPAVMDEVRRDGGVRFLMKDWPIFGASSIRATRLTLGAATLGRYETANAALMATEGRLTEQQVEATLRDAGIDTVAAAGAFERDSEKWNGLVSRNIQQADALGLSGTPTYVAGTTVVPGLIDAEMIREMIRAARGQIA